LLLAVSSGFAEYGYAFVDERADETRAESLERSDALKERARKLYLAPHGYGMRGLEARYPGIGSAVDSDAAHAWPASATGTCPCSTGPQLRWPGHFHFQGRRGHDRTLAPGGSHDQPRGRTGRSVERRFRAGVLITLEASRSGVAPEELQKRMRRHFERALEISKGTRAAPYVSFAENASVPAQNAAEFRTMLEKAWRWIQQAGEPPGESDFPAAARGGC